MNIHLIAIGGSVMHNLALALLKQGHVITGSDDEIYEPSLQRLKKNGILPKKLGWYPEKIHQDLDYIILGMHAKKDNPELLKAIELGIPIYSYPKFIYEHSKEKTRIVIGGSHGKTTITAMVLHVLKYHEFPVDYMIGAQLEGFETMMHLSQENDFIVLEGDEYLSSTLERVPKFHLYRANIAIINGISWDHVNVFPNKEEYIKQFSEFIKTIDSGGILLYNSEDKIVKEIVLRDKRTIRKIPYSSPSVLIENGITYLQTKEGIVPLKIFGNHNLINLEAARWICFQMGLTDDEFNDAIMSFTGAFKRLQRLPTKSKVIFQDFAHSPSKVQASIEAVKNQFYEIALTAIVEFHTYSSLQQSFISQYKNCFDMADKIYIYIDKETLILKGLEEISSNKIITEIENPNIEIINSKKALKDILKNENLNTNVLLLMSSGNFSGIENDYCNIFY